MIINVFGAKSEVRFCWKKCCLRFYDKEEIEVDYQGEDKPVKTPNNQNVYLSGLEGTDYNYAWVMV